MGGRELIEVRVGGYDNESSGPCELPYFGVRALQQACVRDVKRIWVKLSEPGDELARQVLVEEQCHKATRLPIRAANSYTAGKSSGCNSG